MSPREDSVVYKFEGRLRNPGISKSGISQVCPVCPKLTSSNPPVLETKLNGKLNQARIVDCRCNYTEIGRRVSITPGQSELRVIEQIEELSPEIQIRTLAECQRDAFDDREIRIDKVGSVDGSAGGISQLSVGGVDQTLRVKPLAQARAGGLNAADLVGAVEVVPIVCQGYAREVAAVDGENGES